MTRSTPAGGVGAQFRSVHVPGTLPGVEPVDAVLEQFAAGRIASLLGAEAGTALRELSDVEDVATRRG